MRTRHGQVDKEHVGDANPLYVPRSKSLNAAKYIFTSIMNVCKFM